MVKGRGLQNLYTSVRFRPAPPTFSSHCVPPVAFSSLPSFAFVCADLRTIALNCGPSWPKVKLARLSIDSPVVLLQSELQGCELEPPHRFRILQHRHALVIGRRMHVALHDPY